MRDHWILHLAIGLVTATTPLAGQATGTVRYDSVRVNGITLAYQTRGVGEPLVLLHAFSGTSADWDSVATGFVQYRLIIPDLRGHGRSTNPSGVFTHRQAALDIYALLDHLNIQQFKGMGASTGGMTLLHMATSQPERVEAMVLIGATSYFPEQAREIIRSMPETPSDQVLERQGRRHSRGVEQARELARQFRAFQFSYDDMNFTKPYLATITARTLIVHGDRDEFIPVSIPVEEYEAIPTSYLWIVPNGGHNAIDIYTPLNRQFFLETVRAFLAGEWE